MKKIFAAAALLSTFALAGCFGTEKPLFDAKGAVYPFTAGTHYVQYFDDGTGWKEYERGTLTLQDGWYHTIATSPKPDDVPLMLKAWGKNFIVINRVPNDKGQMVYLYGILQPGQGSYVEYGPDCNNFGGGPALKKKGLVDFKPGQEDACAPTSMAALQTLMQMVLDSKAKPDNKYVVVK